ncbi:hypothetical protein [Modestobacter sp. Leaf380]|uniref:hypothetical protein n=1 Tax=Modestobacter sp. Leaf380 TaxID=1736356 RepID=UPI0006FCE0C5|nr:hypothetical protein [Modestobacter sp. Leaf380]KQS68571.1 hypothetical protein ASG41_06365 [Modestobacter sp. Leaf380]
MEQEYAELTCTACGRTVEHELRHVGRLLATTTCTACGHVVEVAPRSMVPAYLHDLEHRVTSKPQRMVRRARRDPARFVRELPGALLRQPAKLTAELWALVRGR